MRVRWFCLLAVILSVVLFGCAHRIYTIGVDNPDNALEFGPGAKVSVKKLPARDAFEYDAELEQKMIELLELQNYEVVGEDSAEYFVLYEYRISGKMAHMNLELLSGAQVGMQTVRRGGPFVHVLELRVVDAPTFLENRYSDSLVWEGGVVLGDVPTNSRRFHDLLLVTAFERLGEVNVEGDSVRMGLYDSKVRKLRD